MNGDIPTDPVQAMLAQVALKNALLPPTSRYYGLETATIDIDGRPAVYLTRRFLPQPDNFQMVQEHTVIEGQRLDNITATYLGDPTMFWRLCDANAVMRPEELTESAGRKLAITLPEGVTGSTL
jgi:hypothetical protein